MGIHPEELGMQPHSEEYEHIGELALWVLDLERRWQEEDSRKPGSRRVGGRHL